MYGHVITKFSRMGSLPHFLTHGDTLRAVRARELRYNLRDGPLEKLRGGGKGHFLSRRNFFSLSSSLYEFFLCRNMDNFKVKFFFII